CGQADGTGNDPCRGVDVEPSGQPGSTIAQRHTVRPGGDDRQRDDVVQHCVRLVARVGNVDRSYPPEKALAVVRRSVRCGDRDRIWAAGVRRCTNGSGNQAGAGVDTEPGGQPGRAVGQRAAVSVPGRNLDGDGIIWRVELIPRIHDEYVGYGPGEGLTG